MANETRKRLYTAVQNAGFDIGNYDDFDRRMNNPGDRKKFFTAVQDAGYDIGSFDEFDRRIKDSKYKLNIGGEIRNVGEKEYKDFIGSHQGTSKARQQVAGQLQQRRGDVQPAGVPQQSAQKLQYPEGWGKLDVESATMPSFMQETPQGRKTAGEQREAKRASYGSPEQARRMTQTDKAIHGDDEAAKEVGLDRANQQLRDRLEYTMETGEELRNPLDQRTLDDFSGEDGERAINFNDLYAPTVQRDEQGNMVKGEDGRPLVGMTDDSQRVAVQNQARLDTEYNSLERRKAEAEQEMQNIYEQVVKALDDPKTTREDIDALNAAYIQARERAEGVNTELEGGRHGFLSGFWDTITSKRTWTLGLDKMLDTRVLLGISEKVKNGEELTPAEQVLLDNKIANDDEQQRLSEKTGKMYQYGEMLGDMLPFMGQIALTGGWGSIAKVGTAAGERWALAFAERFGQEALMKRVAANFLRVTGTGMGDIAAGFASANTLGIGTTINDAMERRIGELQMGENGEYQFVNDEDWWRAILKAEVSQTKEFATERFGEHLPTLREMNVWFAKKGVTARKISRALSGAAGTKVMQATSRWLRKGGINGVGGEILEEEIGLPIDVAIGDMTWEEALGKENQGDIVFGMLTTMGAMHGAGALVQGAGKTYNTAQFYKYKRRADKAGSVASFRMTADKWQPVKEKIDATRNENMGAMWEEIRNNEDMHPQEKRAVFDYMNALMVMRGYSLGSFIGAKDKVKEEPAAEATGTETNADAQGTVLVNDDLEVEMMGAEDAGYSLTSDEDRHAAKQDMDAKRKAVVDMLGEDFVQHLEEDPFGTIDGMRFAQAEDKARAVQAAVDYLNARETYSGMIERVKDDIDTAVELRTEEIDHNTNDQGKMQPATMKADNRKVYVMSGTVAMFDDGSGIDRNSSSESIVVKDAETGKLEMTSPDQILSVDPSVEASQVKQQEQQRIREELTATAANAIEGNTYHLNDQVTLNVDGQQVNASIESEPGRDGKYLVYTDQPVNGKQALRLTADELNALAQGAEKPAAEDTGTERSATGTERSAEAIGTETSADAQGTEAQEQQQAGQESAQEPQGSALDRIPVMTGEDGQPVLNKRGKPVYQWHKASVTDTADALEEISGGDRVQARDTAQQMVEKSEQDLEKAKRVKVKGDDPIEIAENRREVNEQIAEAQSIVSHWKTVAGQLSARIRQASEEAARKAQEAKSAELRAAEEAAREEQRRKIEERERKAMEEAIERDRQKRRKEYAPLVEARKDMADDPEALAIMEDTEPRSLDEWISSLLRPHSIMWNDEEVDGRQVRGLRSELGLNRNDIQRFMTLLAPGNRGGKPFGEVVDEIYAALPEGIKNMYTDQDVRNTLLGMFGEGSVGRMMHLAAEHRIDEARKSYDYALEQEAAAEMEAWAESYHLLPEEREMFEKYLESGIAAIDEEIINQNNAYYDENRTSDEMGGEPVEGGVSEGNETVHAEEVPGEGTAEETGADTEQSQAAETESTGAVETVPGDNVAGGPQGGVGFLDPRTMTDEEKGKRGDTLRNAPAVDVESNVITSSQGLSARKAAEVWWDKNVPEPLFYDTEVGEVEINRNSVESSLAHRYSQAKLDAITSLPDGFENSVYLGTIPDSTRHGNVVNHYFAYPINYNGKRCYVFCRALHDNNTNRLYVHEVFIEENIKKGNTLQTAASQPHGGIALYRDILANVLESSSAGKDIQKSDTKQEKQEKSSVVGLEGYTEEEILDGVRADVEALLEENGMDDVRIVGMAINGSRKRGDAKPDSDLDIVMEYEGDAREDDLFNILSEAGLTFDGIPVDVNPITRGKSGTLEQFMERSRKYDQEKKGNTSSAEEIATEEAKVDTAPTDAQKEAGNYQKGHIKLDGYDVTIENPKGSTRSGKDASGKPWSVTMNNTYGYIRGTEGVDGDHIDVFLSDDPTTGNVFVIDQVNADGTFDEHKVMYGFPDAETASKAYLANYSEGWTGLGTITEVSREEFRKWVDSSHRKTKPFADYKNVKVENAAGSRPAAEQPGTVAEKKGQQKVDENEVKNTVANFPVETPEESAAFDERVPEMSDEELLAYMQEDGNGNVNKAYHMSVYDEYDFRHGDEQLEAYDRYLQSLSESGTTLEQAEDMLANLQKDQERFATEERTELLGQEEALQDYIAELENGTKMQKAGGNAASVENSAMRDAIVDMMRDAGVEVSTDWQEGQRVLDAENKSKVRLMGSRVEKRKKHLAESLGDREMTDAQKTISDVFTGNADNLPVVVSRDGKQYTVVMRQGNENSAGTKHSLYRHYETGEGVFNADDMMRIPDVLTYGEKTLKHRGKVKQTLYHMRDADGTRYTVLTEINNRGDEVFCDFYTNKKASSAARLTEEGSSARRIDNVNGHTNTQLSAQADTENASSGAKLQKVSEPANTSLVFYSNAERAVEGIKQEKATPEQWMKMIEKAGGLKAGEDKWLGLSDWLKDAAAKQQHTLTKPEVLDYIRKNQIQIAEADYREITSSSVEESPKMQELSKEYQDLFAEGMKNMREVSKEMDAFDDEMLEKYGEGWHSRLHTLSVEDLRRNDELESRYETYSNPTNYAFDEMVDRYGEDFSSAFEVRNGALQPIYDYYSDLPNDEALYYLDIFERPINSTRLGYTTNGLSNRQEIALVVPTIAPYNASDEIHFGDAGEGRAVAWVRFGDTIDADGNRVLVIDEIQSKRHQDAREKGYKPSKEEIRNQKLKISGIIDELNKKYPDLYAVGYETDGARIRATVTDEEYNRLQNEVETLQNMQKNTVPAAPFEKNWHELAMKRMLRYAAENGYDKIAWTKGEQQADRYDISNTVDNIRWLNDVAYNTAKGIKKAKNVKLKLDTGSTIEFFVDPEGTIVWGLQEYTGKNLSDLVGKELANRIMADEGEFVKPEKKAVASYYKLEGDGLRVGGDGMKGFYDQILPRFMNKYGKKWGVKTDEVYLPKLSEENGESDIIMHSIDVTPEMKKSVMEGQPMFFRTESGQAYGFTMNGKIYLDPRIATAETPIHEYTHLWAEMKRRTAPEEWNSIKEMLLNDPDVKTFIDKVKKEYADLGENSDSFVEEVLAQYSGRKGAEKMQKIADEIAAEKGGVFGKAEAITALQRMKSILDKFWRGIAKMMGWKYTSAEDISDKILYDLLSGVNPHPSEPTKKELKEFMVKQAGVESVNGSAEKNLKQRQLEQHVVMENGESSSINGSENLSDAKENTGKAFQLGHKFVSLQSKEDLKAVETQRESLPKTAPWREGVEEVTVHTTLANVRKKYGELHRRAKAGDVDAADELVSVVVKPAKIKAIVNKHPNAKVAFVHANEATGRNQIPVAYAFMFEQAGLPLTDIVQANKPNHTGSDRIGRFIRRARFDGNVESGAEYIIVDDHITMGSTLRDLKDFIESKGGKVVAVSTLTASAGATKLIPTEEQIQQLNEKEITNEQLKELGIADSTDGLTRREAAEILILADKGRDPGTSRRREEISGAPEGKAQSESVIGNTSGASIVKLPRINGYGLDTNTAIGRKLTQLKNQGGENTLAGYTDDTTGDLIFLGNDARTINQSIHIKGKQSGTINGMPSVTIPSNQLDVISPKLVRMGYKMAITQYGTVEAVNDRFNEELQMQIDGTLPKGHVYDMGMPSDVLLSTGIPNLPIRLQSSVLNIKANDLWHPYDLSEIKDLVKLIQKPMAIFSYGDSNQAQNLMIGISHPDKEGRQFLVGLSLNPVVKGKELQINSVRTIFPKSYHDWIHWINQGKLLRVDDKKGIKAIIDALRTNPVDYINSDDLNSAANIVNSFENPKYSGENLSDEGVLFRVREEEVPEKTGIGYKVFVLKDGELYPPMVANPGGASTPVGEWLDADAAPVAGESKTGRKQVKAGGKGTQGGSGKLAYRPGWHLGEIPYALQFNRVNPETGQRELFPANFVWAEVEYADDVDYQDEAMSYGMNSNGKFQHSLAGLPRVPENGSYKYRTNPDPKTDAWIITGAMKVNRILKPSEVDEMVKAAGREPQERQPGAVTDLQVEELNKSLFGEVQREGEAAAGKQSTRKRTKEERRESVEFARREFMRAKEIGQEWIEKLGVADDCVIYDSILDVPGNIDFSQRKRNAKGWFDKKTGKVVIILGNHRSPEDVLQTILHECVAHYGLRKLFGKNFDTFLDNVYAAADEDVRRKIDAMLPKYGNDPRKATEEYLASLAEDTDFDNAETETRLGHWLSKIKELFLQMLDKIGLRGYADNGVQLSDNELRYILWRSYKNMVEPGRYRNPFNVAENITMEVKLGVGNQGEGTAKVVSMTGRSATGTMAAEQHIEDEIPQQIISHKDELVIQDKVEKLSPADALAAYRRINAQMLDEHGLNVDELEEKIRQEWLSQHGLEGFGKRMADFTKEIYDKYGSLVPLRWDLLARLQDLGIDVDFTEESLEEEAEDREQMFRDSNSYISARQEYDDRTSGWSYNARQQWQDSMLSLKHLQDAIMHERGEELEDWENAYMAEDRFHGKDKNQCEQYDRVYYQPLLDKVKEVSDVLNQSGSSDPFTGGKVTEHTIDDYLKAKHGLERNQVFAFREAVKEKVKEQHDQERKSLQEQANSGAIDSKELLRKLHDLDMRFGDDVQEAMTAFREDPDVVALKQQYADGNITYRELLEGLVPIMQRHAPKYDDYVQDYGGISELMDPMWYDSIQRIRKEAANTVDPRTKAELYASARKEEKLLLEEAHNKAVEAVVWLEMGQNKIFGELWDVIGNATGKTLQTSYEGGMMSKEQYQNVRDMFDYYVPLRGWEEKNADDVYDYVAKRSAFGVANKKAYGRKSKADSAIATIGNMAVSQIIVSNRNLMKQYFLNMVLNHPTTLVSVSEKWYENTGTVDDDPVWEERLPNLTPGMSADEMADEINTFNAQMRQLQREGKAIPARGRLYLDLHATNAQKDEHVVEVYRNGKVYQLYINGSPAAAQALNGTNITKGGQGTDIIARINRFMAANFTSRNPAFILSNMSRDYTMAAASVAIKENKQYMALFGMNTVRVLGAAMPRLMKRWMNGKLDSGNEIERLFGEFMDEGGETGFVNMLSVDAFKDRMAKEFRRKVREHRVSGLAAFRRMKDTFEFYNRCAEDMTRFIVYVTSRQSGRSVEKSIDDAKNVTLNFNRKGAGGWGNNVFRSAFIFVNPAIQALSNMYEMATGHPWKFTAVTAAWVASGVMIPIINHMLLQLFGDDDDKDSYWTLPDYVRKNNLVLWIPGTHNYVTIPLAQEFRVFYGIGELIYCMSSGHTPDNWGKETLASFMDLLPVNPTGSGGDPLVNFMPTMVQPLVQIHENVSFTGYPIYRDNMGNRYEPEWRKAYAGTPSWMVKSSRLLNDLSGGNEHYKGKLDGTLTNPAVWNHLLEGYFGGLYSVISRSVGVAADLATGELPDVRELPVANRFINRPIERETRERLGNDFYNLKEEHDRVQNEVSKYRKDAKSANEKEREEGARYEKMVKELKKMLAAERRGESYTPKVHIDKAFEDRYRRYEVIHRYLGEIKKHERVKEKHPDEPSVVKQAELNILDAGKEMVKVMNE